MFSKLSNFSQRMINSNEKLKIKKLTESARLPVKGSENAAGFDLFASESVVVQAGCRKLVKTDIAIEKFPANTYGRVAPRSGLSLKNCIDVGAGVIDPDYKGPLNVILINNSDTFFEVKQGMRIAQLICEKCSYPDIEEVHVLSDTARGVKGFGSSGR